jgi:hypothetical protein
MLIPAARNGQDTPPAPFTPHMFRLLAMAAQILEWHLPAALRNDRGSFAALFAAFDPRSRKRPEKRPANAVITGGHVGIRLPIARMTHDHVPEASFDPGGVPCLFGADGVARS